MPCGSTRGYHMSLIFGIFGSLHRLMKRCHMAVHIAMWQTLWWCGRWHGRWLWKWLAWANGWLLHGAVMGCHVAVGKFPMRAWNQIFKNKNGPPNLVEVLPNLVARLSTPTNLNNDSKLGDSFKPHIYCYNYIIVYIFIYGILVF